MKKEWQCYFLRGLLLYHYADAVPQVLELCSGNASVKAEAAENSRTGQTV